MKKFFLFFAAALFCANVNADQAVTVNFGGNATQGHFPVYGDNVDTEGHKVQAIYLADQLKGIAEGSEIKALTFYSAKQNQSWGKAEFKVSLAKTDYSYFQNASGTWATSSTGTFTTVYDGPLSVADGELTVNFTTPYAYEGGNLLIQVEISRGGTYASSSFYSASNTDYLIKYAYGGSSREQKQPKVTLLIAGGGDDPVSQDCHAPTAVTLESVTESTATVSWSGEASQYQYCVAFEGGQPDWTNAQLTDQKTVTLSGLYDEQKYYFYVRSYCSETAVSETVKVTFKTACARLNVPWIETFTRDAAGSETAGDVAPECWIISSANPAVTIVAVKEDDGTGEMIPTGDQHLSVRGGGNKPQIFAMPLFNARLDTCELAFDYYGQVVREDYASLEIGYMTNPADAATFVSLTTLAQTTDLQHVVFPLNDLPAGIEYIAFRFAGGTSNYGTVSMDNFIMAGIGKSADVDPADEDVPDAGIYALSYCEASFTWYASNSSAFAIGLFNTSSQALVAGITVTTEECTRFAYEDGATVTAESMHYCSTKWILNVEESGMQKGDAWATIVKNIGTAASPVLGLNTGAYQVQIYDLVQGESGYSMGDLLATIPFTLVSKEVTNLQAVVAEDHQTATLTWEAPEFASGERLYVRVWAGETVAYDNFETSDRPASPLTVNVVEGKSYTAIVQVIDRHQNPVGEEVSVGFTVGVNQFEPQNPTAVVEGGDNVTFSWTADAQADAYVITLYLNGEFYATLNVHGTSKTTTTPADGTWSWTVQAFNIGENDNYFEASNPIAGNDFVTKSTEVPDDAVELNVIGFNAFYIEPTSEFYQPGLNGWILQFGLDNADYNYAWFLVYTSNAYAISGVYNLTRGNLDGESDAIFLTSGDPLVGTDSEVRLAFDGYDEIVVSETYSVTKAFYTGSFRLVDTDGKTYIGRFMELECSSGGFTNYYYGNPVESITLYDEDPSYFTEGIEEVVAATPNGKKVLYNNQLLIIRDGKAYNVLGTLVK
jgi:hypothetical protein